MKMKRVLTVLLAVLLACGAFAAGSFAEEKQGLFQYEIKEDGTAEITGINDNNIEVLEIPAELDGIPVTSIRGYALWGCKSLQMVIPEGVVSVGHSAFSNCDRLESVSIPDSLVSAGDQPFGLCKNLKTVEVSPDHPVFAVENRALVNRQEQTLICVLDHEDTGTYTVAQGIRRIANCAFDCASFSSIILPDGVTSVWDQAFSFCVNLTEFTFPEGVTDIGTQAFLGCEKLESVTLPDSLTRIGSGVFAHTPALTTVRISPDHPAYEMDGSLLVDKRDQEIVSALNSTPAVFEIPEGIRAIGQLAFQGCRDLTELIVPEGVTKIGWSAFNMCSKLRVITLPASLEEIRDGAFDNCAEDLLIRAPAGSRAEQYAGENGYAFEALPESAD